jgi:hypothetical protein
MVLRKPALRQCRELRAPFALARRTAAVLLHLALESRANVMAYGSRIRRERSLRRRRLLWRAAWPLLIALGLVALGYSAYQSGTMLAEGRVRELSRRIDDLSGQLAASRGDNERLQAGVAEAKRAQQDMQGRYDKDVPKGELADLDGVARERLAQGVPAARLAQVLRDASDTRACDTHATRKRFEITTGKRTPDDTAGFLEGLVQVTAALPAGASDPARTVVTVDSAWANEPEKLTGLPAHQDIVVNNLLLHLVVEPNSLAGYASVTLSTCGKG